MPDRKKLPFCIGIAFAALLSIGAANEKAAPPPGIPEAVQAYANALEDLRTPSNRKMTVERVFAIGRQAAAALMKFDRPGGPTVLEEFTDSEFRAAVAKMNGFDVRRLETVYVQPDPSFFLDIAKRHGGKSDVEFFEAMKQMFPDGASPVYIEPVTDTSGCTTYGTFDLTRLYGRWLDYQRGYPNKYAEMVSVYIHDIESALAENTCACGEKEKVMKELRTFIKDYPSSSITPRVRARLSEIASGTSDMRFQCKPG